jgi:tetratricopeptide (TPR) repeat protein
VTVTPQVTGGGRFWPALLIAVAGFAAYANSFSGPFVFDDVGSIPENPTIRQLWRVGHVLAPPANGSTVSGRPILNLSLALNYAVGGTQVGGYHAANLAIHLLAALVLYGIARRTLRSNPLAAWVIALLWTVHPLQTEAVTFVIQRAESLMSLFYLLTLYCFIRGVGEVSGKAAGRGSRVWFGLGWLACLFGMATKENMVSAPLVVLLYDRTFLAGNFREAWRRRRGVYLALASSWILLGGLVAGGGADRSGSMGFAANGPWWGYGLTQFEAIAHYLRLVVWPHPLVFEYGTFWVTDPATVVPYACVVVPLVGATIWALSRRPAWGFLGFWFFALLAPTSLLSTATQMISEHRMYLALAPVLAAIVCGGDAVLRRVLAPANRKAMSNAWLAALIAGAGVCGLLTAQRNADYRSEEALWSDTVAKRPENALAHNNLGKIWASSPGRLPAAIAEFQAAARLHPEFSEAHNNLGNAWAATPGHLADAVAEFHTALRLKPDYGEAHYNLANTWMSAPGHLPDAIAEYETALRLGPDSAPVQNNLGYALTVAGRPAEAVPHYEAVLRLNPDNWQTQFNLAMALLRIPGREGEARAHLEIVLRLDPGNDQARQQLAAMPPAP